MSKQSRAKSKRHKGNHKVIPQRVPGTTFDSSAPPENLIRRVNLSGTHRQLKFSERYSGLGFSSDGE